MIITDDIDEILKAEDAYVDGIISELKMFGDGLNDLPCASAGCKPIVTGSRGAPSEPSTLDAPCSLCNGTELVDGETCRKCIVYYPQPSPAAAKGTAEPRRWIVEEYPHVKDGSLITYSLESVHIRLVRELPDTAHDAAVRALVEAVNADDLQLGANNLIDWSISLAKKLRHLAELKRIVDAAGGGK